MVIKSLNECRKAFEHWVSTGGDPDWKSYLERDERGEYKLDTAKGAWIAWRKLWPQLQQCEISVDEDNFALETIRNDLEIILKEIQAGRSVEPFIKNRLSVWDRNYLLEILGIATPEPVMVDLKKCEEAVAEAISTEYFSGRHREPLKDSPQMKTIIAKVVLDAAGVKYGK